MQTIRVHTAYNFAYKSGPEWDLNPVQSGDVTRITPFFGFLPAHTFQLLWCALLFDGAYKRAKLRLILS